MTLKKKYLRFVMAFLVVLPVSAIMSFCMRWIHHGFDPHFFEGWVENFKYGFMIAYPSVVLFVWVGQKIVNRIKWID